MRKEIVFIPMLIVLFQFSGFGQDLLSMLDSVQNKKEDIHITQGSFKSVRLINGYTCETAGKNDLIFSISHRFGNVNGGIYEFFGLDQSTIRFGFEYGLNDRIDLGIGRSAYQKLYDGFVKIKLAQQSSGSKNFPFTITLLEGMSMKTIDWENSEFDYPFSARLFYVHELFIARKFTDKITVQLSPVVIHRNLVDTPQDQNIVGAIGIGGRYKIANSFTVVCEYYYLLPGYTADHYENSLALGFEIETGGHVFQLHFSNSTGMTEKAFIAETKGKWGNGDIGLGFNIIRVFNFK